MLYGRFCVCALLFSCENFSRARGPTFDSSSKRTGVSVSSPARHQEGFTLVEIVATIALMGILLVISVGALSYYFSNRALDTASRELTSQVREAQTLAVSTGNTYRIDFSDSTRKTYQLKFKQGSEWVNVRNAQQLPGDVEFSSTSLPSFGGDIYMDFFPRGTTESGQLVLKNRYGAIKTLNVDGETANVGVT